MSKGGSPDIKETDAQKAASEVAVKQWNTYQTTLKPFENLFMDKVDDLNSADKYQKAASDTNLAYAQQFGAAERKAMQGMAAAGEDPMSGSYQKTVNNLSDQQAVGQADTASRAQESQQDKYIAGLKDVVSIGQGQKAEALQGYNDIAESSYQKAASEAQNAAGDAMANRQGLSSLVGTVGGMYTANKMGESKLDKKTKPAQPVVQGYGNIT